MGRAVIHSAKEIRQMRKACQLAADTLLMIGEHVRPGVTTEELNRLVHEYTLDHDAIPAPLNYRGFPKSVCTSINEVVCHGIPGPQVLQDGDIVNVDVTTIYPKRRGFHGDTSVTFYVGEPSPLARHVVEVARESLEIGLQQIKPGNTIGHIGAAIQAFAESKGCSVVRSYTGHGIGRVFHAEPSVPHYGRPGEGTRLRKGMTFTVEPMINLGTHEIDHLDDGWTVLTQDRQLSAQFEHTIVVTDDGCDVLTRRRGPVVNSEDKDWARLGPLSCWQPGQAPPPADDED
ncbi:MAG: type I methionyl aminopeptidase [Alphaproteobacteria bacterium]|nr:type I methionyl aminopeptidase [Alphaproteobacteria bacterium]